MSDLPNMFNQQMNMNNIQPGQPRPQNFQFPQNEMMNQMQQNPSLTQSQLYHLRQQQLNQNPNINLNNNFNNMNNMNNPNLNMNSNKPIQNMTNMKNITFDNLNINLQNQNQTQNMNLKNNMNNMNNMNQKNLNNNNNVINNFINNPQPQKEEDEKEESPIHQNPNTNTNMNMNLNNNNNSIPVPKMATKDEMAEAPTKKLENKFSFLYRIDENAQYPAQKTVMEKEKYESQVKKIAEFDTIEEFWGIFQHLRKPDSCRPGIEYFMFKEPIKPMWEDENNKNGGRFSIKLKQGYTTIIWEEMIFALIGGILPKEMKDEINGIVVTSRKEFNTLQIWFKTYEPNIIKDLEECIRDLLVIPPEVNLDTKPFNKKEYGNNNNKNNNNNNNNKSGGFQHNNRGYNNNNNNNYGGNYYKDHRKNKNHNHKNNK